MYDAAGYACALPAPSAQARPPDQLGNASQRAANLRLSCGARDARLRYWAAALAMGLRQWSAQGAWSNQRPKGCTGAYRMDRLWWEIMAGRANGKGRQELTPGDVNPELGREPQRGARDAACRVSGYIRLGSCRRLAAHDTDRGIQQCWYSTVGRG